MASRTSRLLIVGGSLLFAASVLRAQEMPNPQAMQMQVQRIAQERPREAEAAARAWLHDVAPELILGLDSLKSATPDPYWMEVAHLTVQFDVFQNLMRRDTVRAQLVARMFGLEANARAQQRAYRAAVSEAVRTAIRPRIEALITQHFDVEDKLRSLEVADIERRLAEVRAETQRRRDKRAEFVKWAVDDIIRDATRPQ
ncbi:MAG TPA: hypothetical protein VN908_09550 [Gemmatimonadales bacterium]|nr:hypothetical protein [Gemmatimonadales bacterium]